MAARKTKKRPILTAMAIPDPCGDNDSLWAFADGMRAQLTPAFEKRLGFNRSPVYYDDDTVRTWVAGVLLALRDVVVDGWRLERINGEHAKAIAYRGWAIRTLVRYLVVNQDEREALEGLMRMQPSRTQDEVYTAKNRFRSYLFELLARAAEVPVDSLAFVVLVSGTPGDDNYE